MANQVIRVGMVGLGNWARYGHLPALTHLPNYAVTAVWSRRADHAAAVAKEFVVAAVEAEYRSLVTRPDVDLVAILVPAPQHAEVVRAAIAARKDVYCEWPLATTTADGEDLSGRVTRAGVRHVVGLQRRFGPSARYLRELIADGFVGTVRSVRMHVSMEYFTERRGPGLEWTVDPANFSHILSIYGGHFFDMLFRAVGFPAEISALVRTQFPTLTLDATGETFPNRTPDQVVVIGSLQSGAVLTVQIEGGKRNGSGLQVDVTGTAGDIKMWNPKSFTNPHDNIIEGARGDGGVLERLTIPARLNTIPPSSLDVSVQDLAHLYAAFARGEATEPGLVPKFDDAVRLHRFINRIAEASESGRRTAVGDIWDPAGGGGL